MPADLPYMPSVTNVPKILARIKEAATPPKFTNEFLKTNLGFASSNDRSVIKVLKAMGFLSADGTPTPAYNDYRGSRSGTALASGVRRAYAPLFLSDENANAKTGTELLGIVKNTSGAGDAVAKKISTTFKAFADRADWTDDSTIPEPLYDHKVEAADTDDTVRQVPSSAASNDLPAGNSFRLHHDIHLHLPPTSDVSVYRAIFQAMKSELI